MEARDTEEAFDALVAQLRAEEAASAELSLRRARFAAGGLLAGLVVTVSALSTSLWASFGGYVLMLIAGHVLASEITASAASTSGRWPPRSALR